jgi:DNA-binding PadR family transcriptional regulator
MDKIILGLLMLQRLTVYEIRNIISKNFQPMCSDSMGSIQAAMKKLLSAGMVVFTEYVENGVNKKRYSITDAGRNAFSLWITTPADLSSGKNMELGKLLFLGLAPADERQKLVGEMIGKLETELSFLRKVQASVDAADNNKDVEYLLSDPEYCEGIQNATNNTDMTTNINDIGYFQLATLQYGIDTFKFNIDWLKSLREKMEKKTK